MAKIARDNEVVELNGPPAFRYGDKVLAKYTVRNDGTYAGKEIGDVLVRKGDLGVVMSIGTFLQQFYIYGVEFFETGNRVGMKRREVQPVAVDGEDDEELPTALKRQPLSAGGVS